MYVLWDQILQRPRGHKWFLHHHKWEGSSKSLKPDYSESKIGILRVLFQCGGNPNLSTALLCLQPSLHRLQNTNPLEHLLLCCRRCGHHPHAKEERGRAKTAQPTFTANFQQIQGSSPAVAKPDKVDYEIDAKGSLHCWCSQIGPRNGRKLHQSSIRWGCQALLCIEEGAQRPLFCLPSRSLRADRRRGRSDSDLKERVLRSSWLATGLRRLGDHPWVHKIADSVDSRNARAA